MREKQIHEIFEISVLLKGVHALLECVAGLGLAFTTTSTLTRLILRFTEGDFVEDHLDWIATKFQMWASGFSIQSQHFYEFYLLSHGIVKLALVAGLLKRKLWAYLLRLLLWVCLSCIRFYRYYYTHAIGLVILTFFDLIVLGLI